MRVCIVTPAEPGVSETFIRAHLDGLPHEVVHLHGHALDYACAGRMLRDRHPDLGECIAVRLLNLLPRFMEFRLRARWFAAPGALEVAARFLREENIDVVLAEYGPTAALISPACQVAGIPLVAHFHGFDASRYDTIQRHAEDYRIMFQYAAAVISVSAAMTRALVDLGCPPEKIRENPYGPAPSFSGIRPDYQSNLLVAVGRHTAKKAPYLTLDAFRRAHEVRPELQLCLIGAGELMEVSERLVEAWDLRDCVELVGAANPAQIAQSLAKAFALVQHSVQAHNGDCEGMPVAILEAAAAGLPVIATLHAGIPEAVIDGLTGFLVAPGDTRAMAAKILELAGDRTRAQLMGMAAREHVARNFSMDRHLAALSAILVAACRTPRPII